MKLEINLSKGKFWVLVVLVVLAIGIGVYAAIEKPNPGHSVEEIGGLEDKIKDLTLTTIRDSFKIMPGETKPDEVTTLSCDNGKKAVGCSFYSEKDEDNPDEIRCKVDDSGCTFYSDTDEDFVGADSYCYCI